MIDNKNEQIKTITNVIQNSTDKDLIYILDNITAKSSNIELDLAKIAKEKGVEMKNMNIVFVYSGKNNKIDGSTKINIYTEKPNCPICSSCQICPSCPTCEIPKPCIYPEQKTFTPISYGLLGVSSFIIFILIIYMILSRN